MAHTATYIRIFASDPTDEMVEKRAAAIDEIATTFKARRDVGELLGLANDIAAAVQADGQLSPALTITIEGVIRKASTAFVADGHQLEMLVCGMVGALQAVSGGTVLAHGLVSITDVFSLGLWSALSFQKPRAEPKLEELRYNLVQAAHAHCDMVARESRKRAPVADPEFEDTTKKKEGEPEVPFSATTVKGGLQPFRNAIANLKSNAVVDREEIDLLWWALSDWSSLLHRRFSDEKASGVAAVVASGIEAGQILRRMPAEAHRHLVSRNIKPGKSLSTAELLSAVAQDRVKLKPKDGYHYITMYPTVFPLLNALATGQASGADAKIKRPLEDWAARALLESAIANLCTNIKGTSV